MLKISNQLLCFGRLTTIRAFVDLDKRLCTSLIDRKEAKVDQEKKNE